MFHLLLAQFSSPSSIHIILKFGFFILYNISRMFHARKIFRSNIFVTDVSTLLPCFQWFYVSISCILLMNSLDSEVPVQVLKFFISIFPSVWFFFVDSILHL